MFAVTKSQVGSQSDDNWKVDICGGTCSCPAFLHSMQTHVYNIPPFPPVELGQSTKHTNSPHTNMVVQSTVIMNMQEADHGVEVSACSSTSSNTTQSIPVKTTGAQVYRFQKQVEEMLGRCRTLAFLTNETSVLTKALSQCQTVMETLLRCIKAQVRKKLALS